MKPSDIVIAILIPFGIFLVLSWGALGSTFIPIVMHQDIYVLGVGDGISMYPTIKSGDYLIVDVTPENLHVGQIVVFMEGGEIIGHRIVRISGDTIITKGDNNNYSDPPITRRRIIGEVERILDDPLSKYIAEIWFVGVKLNKV